jgi:hypothetical protein
MKKALKLFLILPIITLFVCFILFPQECPAYYGSLLGGGIYGLGSLYGLGLYSLGGLYGLGLYGLEGFYGLGLYGLGSLYSLGSLYGLSGLYGLGIYGIGGLNSLALDFWGTGLLLQQLGLLDTSSSYPTATTQALLPLVTFSPLSF